MSVDRVSGAGIHIEPRKDVNPVSQPRTELGVFGKILADRVINNIQTKELNKEQLAQVQGSHRVDTNA